LDFARIERELAEEIGRRVDFVSVSGLKPEVRARVEREAIRAF
jgi:predicted nucleotidyltransferase